MEAILAHEMCHVRCRDNLTAAISYVVECDVLVPSAGVVDRRAVVEERERACDEEVLKLGSEPERYAEGILKVCVGSRRTFSIP